MAEAIVSVISTVSPARATTALTGPSGVDTESSSRGSRRGSSWSFGDKVLAPAPLASGPAP
ncbi:hypothetical protein N7U49_37215 [Streptomyces sp. AD2-2]|nr:hypothetical protein N7U49_37215 [Streptomyces sp. AD2-2]